MACLEEGGGFFWVGSGGLWRRVLVEESIDKGGDVELEIVLFRRGGRDIREEEVRL